MITISDCRGKHLSDDTEFVSEIIQEEKRIRNKHLHEKNGKVIIPLNQVEFRDLFWLPQEGCPTP